MVALCLGSRSGVAWELVPRSAGSGLLSQAHRVMHSMSLTISLSVQPNAFKYWISLLSSLAVISFISFHLPLRISRPGGAFDFFLGNREAEREFHFREPRGMNPFRLRCSDVPLPIASPIRMCKPEETVKGEERKNSRISHALCREIFPAFDGGNGLHTVKARRRRGNRRTPLGAEKEKGKVPL